MKLANAINPIKGFFEKKPSDWLVLEFNGFVLKGVRARVEDGEISIEKVVQSTKATLDACFVEVVDGLRDESAKQPLPKEAILITSQAASSVMELPINPHGPYTEDELTELVRWEFEQQLTEQLASLTLDTIMVGRGLITEPEVDEAREIMLKENPGTRSVAAAPGKFGDQIEVMGLAERKDINECLQFLEAFQTMDDELSCKFFPLTREGDAPGESGFPWLVCGTTETVRRQWVTRFETKDIRLDRVYPLCHTSSGALEPLADDSQHAVLELLEGLDSYAVYEGNQLKTLRWGNAPLSPRNPEALVNLIGADRLDNLWISGRDDIARPVAAAITEGLKIPVRPFPKVEADEVPVPSFGHFRLDGMVGSLRHTEKQSKRNLPWAEGAGPGPPWFKQASKWWGIVGTTLTLLLIASEVSLAVRRHSASWTISQIESQVSQVKGEIAKVEGQSKEATSILKKIGAQEHQLAEAKTALDLIATGLEFRREYALNLLFTLAGAVTQSLAVDEFEESADHSLRVVAWAISEKEAQGFVRAVVRELSQWGLNVTRQEVTFSSGRMGLSGYTIVLQLSPNPTFVEET